MPFLKDGIDRAVVHGDLSAVNPDGEGTKAAFHHEVTVPAGGAVTLRFRLTDSEPAAPRTGGAAVSPFADFDEVMGSRRDETDLFWQNVLPESLSSEEQMVCRQALSGMLWSKQYYMLDIERWLVDHGADPLDAGPGAAQPRVAPYGRRGHHLHARQVGVPVVRGVGPGLSHRGSRRGGQRASPRVNCSSC